jgi:outer membrane protein TolC
MRRGNGISVFFRRSSVKKENACKEKMALWALLLLPVISFAANEEATLNLEEAISLGLRSSPALQKAEAAKEEASWKKAGTLKGFLPSVSLDANHSFTRKYQFLDINFGGNPVSIPQIFPSTSASLTVVMPVFDGLKSVRQRGAASSESQAADEDYRWGRFRLEQDIRLRFNQVLAARALELVAQQNLKTATEQLARVRTLKSGGSATKVDVLRSEVQLSEAQNQLVEAKDNLHFMTQKLFVTMGTPDLNKQLSGSLPEPEITKIDAIQWESESQRPDISALKHRLEASESRENADSAFWIPTINLLGQYIKYNNRNDNVFDSANTRDAYNVAVSVSWNLFDGLGSYSKSREAVYRKVQVEKSLEEVRQQAPLEFHFWKRKYLNAAAVYKTKLADVEKSEESLRLMQESYRLGSRTNSEVLEAILDLFKTRAAVVNAQTACVESQINLETVLGRKI